MRQKGGRVPRDISIQGTLTTENGDEYEPLYRHPADEQPELVSWTPAALKIKERIEEVIEQKLNHALIQYYRNGKDFIGEHSDKTLDVLLESNIVNYSLGAARTMILKNKSQDGLKQRFKLPHNSLFVLGWKTNREWFHSIKQDNRADRDKEQDELAFSSQRISLTLRTIATFRNRRTGQLFGQGARNKTIEQISEEQLSNESDEQDMLMAFSAENKLSLDFDWNQYYGRGFNALNFKVLNSVFKDEENK
jgi:alkylated DNA repair dioxygenase AlkB